MTTTIEGGLVHDVPDDLRAALIAAEGTVDLWNGLTAIQRNEWICWVTIVKKAETRANHIHRLIEELNQGKRQPCCWPGCPHRRPAAQKWHGKRLQVR